jgi:hypothetical protein
MNIIITGERAEGKTILALVLEYLLTEKTDYNVTVNELHAIPEFHAMREAYKKRMNMEAISNLNRDVNIIVVNNPLP